MVEHCVSSAKGYGFDSQEAHTDSMHCKSLWIKASVKCINVNVFLIKMQNIFDE